MGKINPLQRQPDVLNYAQNNQFKLFLPIFPTTEYFCTRVNIPGVSLGQANQPTPLVDMPLVGDKLQYDTFNASFLVDEEYKNYIEMYGWLKNIGFPEQHKQYNSLERPDNINRSTTKVNEAGIEFEDSDRNLYCDILVTILNSKNNPVAKITMYESFPISVGSLEYSQQETDTTYLSCDLTFAYSWFDIESV